MSNNTQLSTNVGAGDIINTTDCSSFSAISATGKMPGSLIFTSTATNVAPACVIDTRPLPVCVRNASGTTLGDATTPLQVSLANTAANSTAIKVDGSGVTQPVSGTVSITANSAVNVAQINGVTPLMGNGVTGTGSQRVTIASDNTAFTVNAAQSGTWNITNVSGTVSLPTGAATAAKQPALGTAGSASADVISVQGIASMTALKVDGSAVTQPVSGTVSITANSAVNLAQVNGTTTDTNSGNKSAGTIRVVIATDQPQLTNKLLVTPDANSAVNMAQAAGNTLLTGNGVTGNGSPRVTIASDNTAFSVNAQPNASTSGGCSMFTLVSAASNNSTQVKGSAGNIYCIVAVNTTATINYFKIFDGAPTMGTTNANWNIPVPANTSAAGVVIPLPVPISCANTINVALTGGMALNDNTNAATGVAINLGYK